MAIAEFKDVTRVYTTGDHEPKALDGVNLTLDEGKFIVILGPSGAGKSTLLNMLGGLDSPTKGTIIVNGKDISTLNNNELADYRASTVGFVFQFYNLVPTLTVYENVALVSEYELSIAIGWTTFVISIALTFGVSLLVGLMVARKNKKIDMVGALKGAE